MRLATAALLAMVLGFALPPSHAQRAAPAPPAEVGLAELPAEAHATVKLIRKQGPYPYAKDGSIFGNREGQLPKQPRGYYREYTVKTPG